MVLLSQWDKNNKRPGRNSAILSSGLHQIWRLLTKLYSAVYLRWLMDRHGMDAYHLLEPGVLVDLSPIATGAFAFPTYGTGLKHIAKWLGFKWRHDNMGATSAIEMYLAYVEDPESNKDKMRLVQDYNEDDCRATLVIKDWLGANSHSKPADSQ